MPDGGALVPGLCLLGAHLRELLEVLLVIEQRGRNSRQFLAGRGDRLVREVLVLLVLLQIKVCLLDEIGLGLHEGLVSVNCFDLQLVHLVLLVLEVLEEPLKCRDDVVRVELVVLHVHGRHLCRAPRPRIAQAQRICQERSGAHSARGGLELHQRRLLRGLQGLQSTLKRLNCTDEVCNVLLILCQLPLPRIRLLPLLLLCLFDVLLEPGNRIIQFGALFGQRVDVRGESVLPVPARLDVLGLLACGVLAETRKLVVCCRLLFPLGQDLLLQSLQQLGHLVHCRHLGILALAGITGADRIGRCMRSGAGLQEVCGWSIALLPLTLPVHLIDGPHALLCQAAPDSEAAGSPGQGQDGAEDANGTHPGRRGGRSAATGSSSGAATLAACDQT
mmetsp:Transcript_71111/g.196353  ORF Transcript_71111/g.196353 Transcript_71111/m.196353 type:complete len:390 (+) Transcript_71111:1391-2560(+)